MAQERKTFYIPVFKDYRNFTATTSTYPEYYPIVPTTEDTLSYICIEPIDESNHIQLPDEEMKFMEKEMQKAISAAVKEEAANQLKDLSDQVVQLQIDISRLTTEKNTLQQECKALVEETKASLSEISKIAEEQKKNVMRFLHLDLGD